MRTRTIQVLPYDRAWKNAFEQIRQELAAALGDSILGIEHVGSTAVEGLSAKPCIDIDIIIESNASLQEVIERLGAIGYIHEGNLGIQGREAFKYSDKSHLQAHHLYVCPQDSAELHRHLTFRNFLRTHPEAARKYGAVKEEAARKFPHDIEGYIEYKSACIREFYQLCGLKTE